VHEDNSSRCREGPWRQSLRRVHAHQARTSTADPTQILIRRGGPRQGPWILYGKKRTLSKFKVLELVARVPYQTWEQVAYIAITHMHGRRGLARRIYDRVRESREQQDNEQWHLLILEERIANSGKHENRIYYFWIPQAIALVYYHISWLLFVLRPDWSYRLNADFEDHAEHEYMYLVTEHPEWETTPFDSDFAADYGSFASVADLFRQIGHDERFHKEGSIAALASPRFS
jgi:ubiquinol oxidase